MVEPVHLVERPNESRVRNGRNNHIIVGQSPLIEKLRQAIAMVAPTDVPVLITGETGTGKELVAHALHKQNPRSARFVALNCAAIPEGLVESELFGHTKGAFTGAIRERKGRFEQASDGTLFLDEIGDMPLSTQVKLLRVLEVYEFEPVGGSTTMEVNTRVVCATNQDLEAMTRERRFRDDLLTRLNTVEITVPPLRERPEDVPLLVGHFLGMFNERNGKEITIDEQAVTLIMHLIERISGNVRGLRTVVERAAVFSEYSGITIENPAFENLTKPKAVVARPGLPDIRGGPITEDVIGAAIREYGPFKFKLKYVSPTNNGNPRRHIEIIAASLGVTIRELRTWLESNGKHLTDILANERRKSLLSGLMDNPTVKELEERLGTTIRNIRFYGRQLGIYISITGGRARLYEGCSRT